MKIHDVLYGNMEVSGRMVPLMQTQLVARMRGITMASALNEFLSIGPFPSRFHHCNGSRFLGTIINQMNALSQREKDLIEVSALLHDSGNGPGAHMLEELMQQVTGYNGETFIRELMDHFSDTKVVLRNLGIDPEEVALMVTGQNSELSKIIHGSLDIDNLDNLARSNYCLRMSRYPHDPIWLATRFRFRSSLVDGWHFQVFSEMEYNALRKQLGLWKNLRRGIYNFLFTAPHTIITSMIRFAAHIAYENGFIKKDFFYKTDHQAMDYLLSIPCDPCRLIMEDVRQWRYYHQIFSLKTTEPSQRLRNLASVSASRFELARQVAEEFNIPFYEVTAFLCSGNQERCISTPIIKDDQVIREWDIDVRPETYHLQINVHSRHVEKLQKGISEFVKSCIA